MLALQSFIKNMKQFKILIVDDEAPMRRNVRSILQTLGFSNFREAEDGDDALRKLHTDKFGFVTCDWQMPLMSGPALLHAIRKERDVIKTPFLIITSQAEADMVMDYLTSNLEDHVVTPLLPQTIEDKMVSLLFRNLEPTEFEIHLQKAGTHMAKKRFRLAHEELDQAHNLNPRSPIVSYFRNLVYTAEGDPAKAEEAVAQARKAFVQVVHGPWQANENISRGQLLLSEGRVPEAKILFDEALKLDPDNPDRLAEIGDAYLAQGLADEAEKVFKASIEANPGMVCLYNRLGMAYRRQRKFEEAIAAYKRAILIDPQEENLHYNLARAFLAAGDRTNAIGSLRNALNLVPDFKEARDLLERVVAAETQNKKEEGLA